MGYSPWGHKELDMLNDLAHTHTCAQRSRLRVEHVSLVTDSPTKYKEAQSHAVRAGQTKSS